MRNRNGFNFNLKKPCKDCPFRTNIKPYLNKERCIEISESMTKKDSTFPCHKTVNYSKEKTNKPESQCAGAMIILIKEKSIYNNFLFRLALLSGMTNINDYDLKEPIFNSFSEWIKANT